VLIPAAACIDFVNRHFPGICQLTDLGFTDLSHFLAEQGEALQRRYLAGARWRVSVAFSDAGAAQTPSPLFDISQVNGHARELLDRNAEPPEIAIALEGREFAQFLRTVPLFDDPEVTLLRFLSLPGPARLTIPDVWLRCFRERRVRAVLLGYECTYLGTDYGPVRAFMNRLPARSSHA
jgi:hypothetical protein